MEYLPLILGAVGALTGFVAAVASVYSARAAAISARHAEGVERRKLLAEVITASHTIVATASQIDDLGAKLKLAQQSLATFSGNLGSSRFDMYLKQTEDTRKEAISLKTKAEEHAKNETYLRRFTSDELMQLLAKLEGWKARATVLKSRFEQDLQEVEEQNKVYREKTIKGPARRPFSDS